MKHVIEKKEILTRNAFSRVEWVPKYRYMTLRLWENGRATYDHLLDVQREFARFIAHKHPRNILIDTRNFSMDLPESYTDWISANVETVFKKVFLKKMAYLVRMDIYQFFQNAELDFNGTTRKVFLNEVLAIRWLIINTTSNDRTSINRLSL